MLGKITPYHGPFSREAHVISIGIGIRELLKQTEISCNLFFRMAVLRDIAQLLLKINDMILQFISTVTLVVC